MLVSSRLWSSLGVGSTCTGFLLPQGGAPCWWGGQGLCVPNQILPCSRAPQMPSWFGPTVCLLPCPGLWRKIHCWGLFPLGFQFLFRGCLSLPAQTSRQKDAAVAVLSEQSPLTLWHTVGTQYICLGYVNKCGTLFPSCQVRG